MTESFQTFTALHVPGNPLILFNVWDAGSAIAAERAGAKAIATGSASVAAAQGMKDGEILSINEALANAQRIAGAVHLQVTVAFDGGYAVDPDSVAANHTRRSATGAIGCHLTDPVVGGDGLHAVELPAKRPEERRGGEKG